MQPNTCTMPHFLPGPTVKQSLKSCSNVLLRSEHVSSECVLFTPRFCGCGMKNDVWSCHTSFPSELIRTDKLTQRAAERLGGRKAQEAWEWGWGGGGVAVEPGCWAPAGFSWLCFFPLCSCQEWKHSRPQQRDDGESFTCVPNIFTWYSFLPALAQLQIWSNLQPPPRFAHAKCLSSFKAAVEWLSRSHQHSRDACFIFYDSNATKENCRIVIKLQG